MDFCTQKPFVLYFLGGIISWTTISSPKPSRPISPSKPRQSVSLTVCLFPTPAPRLSSWAARISSCRLFACACWKLVTHQTFSFDFEATRPKTAKKSPPRSPANPKMATLSPLYASPTSASATSFAFAAPNLAKPTTVL